jgi:mRNA-degrading endonuclease toxin of MazEF toxin-antitoxin module
VPTDPNPGEVWFAELGMVEKSRPVLVLAFPGSEDARALAVVAPLTSQIRGMRGEVDLGKPRWLPKRSAVNVQGLASLDHRKLTRRLGELSPAQMEAIKAALRDLLNLY